MPRAWPGPALAGRLPAGLADPRVEPEVGDQLLRGAEPGEVADGRDDRQGHGRVHARDGHQSQYLGPGQGCLAQLGVDQAELGGVEIQLPQ